MRPKIILNAVESWGKTSFGAYAPNPTIIMCGNETGFATLRAANRAPDVPQAHVESWEALLAVIPQVETDLIVLDALGGAERLCHVYVCATEFKGVWGEKGFSGFQRGAETAVNEWVKLLAALEQSGKSILICSHAKVSNYKNPLGPDYDRFTVDCAKQTWNVTHRWSDAVLFGQFFSIVQESKGRAKGVGGKERLLYTERTDSYDAKNRYGMPECIEIPDDPTKGWSIIAPFIQSR